MRRFLHALSLAFAGILYSIREERHMRIHITAAVLVCALASVLQLQRIDWAILLLAIGLVICAEIVNTAVERTINLTAPNPHPLAKIAKDVAAGAVLAAVIIAIAIGVIVLGPPLWNLIF